MWFEDFTACITKLMISLSCYILPRLRESGSLGDNYGWALEIPYKELGGITFRRVSGTWFTLDEIRCRQATTTKYQLSSTKNDFGDTELITEGTEST